MTPSSRHLALCTPLWCAALFFAPAPIAAEEEEQGHGSGSVTEVSQKAIYEVSWHDATVAYVKLHQGCAERAYTPYALTASSTGLADELHSFSVRLDSFLPHASSLPKQARTAITEGGRTRRYISTFSSSEVRVKAEVFGEEKRSTRALPRPSHDLLSWMLDLGQLAADASLSSTTYTVWDGWKLVELKVARQNQETLSTPHARYEKAHTFTVTRTRLDADNAPDEESSKLATLWFSDAASPQLIALDFESPVGLATVRLAQITEATCPAR